MDPISNADRLALLLRQRLLDRSKTASASKAKGADPRAAARSEGPQALARLGGLDEKQLRRALIQTLLADQFGDRLMNDARFQQVVDRVSEALDDDPDSLALVNRVLADMRASGR